MLFFEYRKIDANTISDATLKVIPSKYTLDDGREDIYESGKIQIVSCCFFRLYTLFSEINGTLQEAKLHRVIFNACKRSLFKNKS